MKILKLEQVSKFYKSVETVSVGMQNVSLEFEIGEFIAITGESGSGKSTLLNVISGLDSYESGELYHYGEETSHYTISDWERYRSAYIGFVFQNYNIIDSYTVYQNVMLALEVQGYPRKDRKKRALELIEKVGLTSHKNHKASKLSGGQKQRAVIARALAKDCPIIVADEPTGNLDSHSSKQIMELLNEVSQDKLVIVVTHDYDQVKPYASRRIKMHDGEVVEDVTVKKHIAPTAKVEPEINKMSLSSVSRVSLRNMLSTPKRTLFLMTMQIIVIVIISLVFSSLIKGIRETGLEQSSLFPNVPETRLLIEKRDGSTFTSDEIDAFNKNKDILAVYQNHQLFYNETELGVRHYQDSNEYNYYNYIGATDSTIVLKENEVEGKLPVKSDEVVISDYWGLYKVGDTVEIVAAAFFSWDDDDLPIIGKFTVVGIDKKDRNTVYFSEAYLTQSNVPDTQINYSMYSEIYRQARNNSYVVIDGFQLYLAYPAYFDMTADIQPQRERNIVTLENQTVDVIVEFWDDVPFTKRFENLTVKYNEEDNQAWFDYLYFNKDLFDELIEDVLQDREYRYLIPARNLLSVEVKGYFAGNQVIKKIDDDIYKVYYPANISSPFRQIMVFLSSLLTFSTLFLLSLFLYTIIYAVTRNVMAARKKDFAIFRSIGTNKKELAKMVVLEQVFLNIVGFVITISILFILQNQISSLGTALAYMRFTDYLILFVLFIGFGIWIGLRFNKRIFDQSVIQVLTLSRGDF